MLPDLPISALQRVHPAWLAQAPEWREIESVRTNRRADVAQHLVQGVLESTLDWKKRLQLTRFAPESITARHGFVGQVMDCEPNRDSVPDQLREWAASVDRHRRTLADWIEQRALPLATDFGAAFAFVDSPRVERAPQTLAEQQAMGADQVLLSAYGPLSVRNWQTDSQGALQWVVMVEDVAMPAGALGARMPMRRYIVLDADSWLTVLTSTQDGRPVVDPNWDLDTGEPTDDVQGKDQDEAEVERQVGTHGCSRVPLVPFIIDPETDLVGRSLLRNAVQVDLRRLNHESDQDYAFHLHGHPQLALKSTKGPKDVGVGVQHCVQLNPEEGEELGYVQLDATSFRERREEIMLARKDVHRHAGGDPMAIADDSGGGASGKARQVSARNSTGRHVKRVRTGLANLENGIMELVAEKRSVAFDAAQHGVSYPTRFLQETDMEVIETTSLAKKNTRSPSAKVELELRMLDRVLPGLATDARAKITDEVRTAPPPMLPTQFLGGGDTQQGDSEE